MPTPALDMALWMESERMGHLLGAVTQEKLDQERAVVKNEKRQGDNQPYGRVVYSILEGLFPPGHPYRHDSIGSMADLDAASVDDVHAWFRQYYGAANAVLVLAGDLSPQEGLALARKYFGDIDPGPPLTRMQASVPARLHDTVEVMVDDVPHVRSYHNWVVPGRTRRDRALLDLAADVLGDGKNSRLYQALVLETGLAIDVSVDLEPHELASIFSITVTLAPDAALDDANAIVDDELGRLLRLGPGEEELKRARTKFNADLVRGLERVGGFTGKAAVLASGELYDGRPDFYKTLAAWINEAEAEEVRETARRWLSTGRYRLDVLPAPDFAAGEPGVDRSLGIPPVGDLPAVSFPPVERASLRNGIEVVLAQRSTLPLVNVTVGFDAGYADDAGGLPGAASFTLAMLEESTASRSALEVEALAESLGAELSTAADLDTSLVLLSALKPNLVPSIDLLADVVRNPAFAEEELERLRLRWLARIESEWSDPVGVALRTLPPLLYGEDHAYGIPFTGSGTVAAIEALERSDLERFHQHWLRPDNATLFVVGDTTMDEILPALESAFGDWRPQRRKRPGKDLHDI
ncbi:MAG: pitrilysin family protein, partial [Xanthomonadales bacterium]|nr:pitrilysin family protein [Xanthomonadales bacterium]